MSGVAQVRVGYYTHSLSAGSVAAHFAAGHREGVVLG